MSRALNAMKDIDKKTPPVVDNNALPTGTNHVEPKPQAPVQPAPITPPPAPPEPVPAAPAFEPEPVQPIAPPAAPAVQPTPVAQAVPVAKPVEKSKGGFMGIMSKTLKAIKDIDKPS
jgi:hypothetical protein